jgi:hypothetical protein
VRPVRRRRSEPRYAPVGTSSCSSGFGYFVGRGSRTTLRLRRRCWWDSRRIVLRCLKKRAEPWPSAGSRLGALSGVAVWSGQDQSAAPIQSSGSSGASPRQVASADEQELIPTGAYRLSGSETCKDTARRPALRAAQRKHPGESRTFLFLIV